MFIKINFINSYIMNKIKTFEGDILYYNDQKDIGDFLKLYKGLDPHYKKQNLYKIIDSELKPTDNIVEIGAQIGNMTVFLAKRNYSGKIYSFEPNEDNYQVLLKNIKENNLQNQVVPYKIALNSFSDKLRVPDKADKRWKNLKEQALLTHYFKERVKITPLLGKYKFTDIEVETSKLSNFKFEFNFILSRISSNSLDILEDIKDYLKDNNVKMLLEWYPSLSDEKHHKFFNFMYNLNYKIYRFTKNGLKIVNNVDELKIKHPKGCWVDILVKK